MSGMYKCPQCGQELTRKRGGIVRYRPVKNKLNTTMGEYRYLPKYCKCCQLPFYFRESRLYHQGAQWRNVRPVGEQAYFQASPYPITVQTTRATAGEFTRRIARAADTAYVQRYSATVKR